MMQEQSIVDLEQQDESSKKKRRILLLLLLLLLIVGLILLTWQVLMPRVPIGSRIIPSFSGDVNEDQGFLTDAAEKSRITVSLKPSPCWDDATEDLDINFVVDSDNNGFAERFVLKQDDQVVYESDHVLPGYVLPTVKVPGLHLGAAIATVYAVDQDGRDYGNPVSVELTIQSKKSINEEDSR